MKILIIEDDARTLEFLTRGLKECSHAVQAERDGRDGLLLATTQDFDAAIIDVGLPSIDGLGIVRAMRDQGRSTPVLILTARNAVEDRVRGLDAGADDYLSKPFAMAELLARVRALLRRREAVPATQLRVGDLEIDLLARTVRRGSRGIELQPREFALLEFLARHAGRVVTKTMILEHVWEYDFDPKTNVVESRMSHLRQKIDLPPEPALIHTVRGVGYVIRSDT